MEKKLACYDIDGTLAKGMLDIPIVISECKNGFVNFFTCAELAALMVEYKLGKIDYETASDRLIRAHAFGLRGRHESEVANHAEKYIQENYKKLFREFGKIAIELLRKSHRQIIVTAAPGYIANGVKNLFNMDDIISTQYEIHNGIYTGNVPTSLAHKDAKINLLGDCDIDVAFGDSERDIEMLRKAKHPFCISPTKGLARVANEEGWAIYEDSDSSICNKINKSLII